VYLAFNTAAAVAVRTAAGAYFPAGFTTVPTGRIYQEEVPDGTNVFVTIFSRTFSLMNGLGTAIPASQVYKVPISVSAGAVPAKISINLTGKVLQTSVIGN
jgi:hypothetical protein